jgi:hypothetical protein
MGTWTRAAQAMRCGGPCAGHFPIAVGDPVMVFKVRAVSTRFVRCVVCAGEPVPADLPAYEPPVPKPPTPPVQPREVDVKARAAGEREPGEDDAD